MLPGMNGITKQGWLQICVDGDELSNFSRSDHATCVSEDEETMIVTGNATGLGTGATEV